MCVQGTAVLQRYMGRSEGDTDELQLWPRGLWELWLEQCGRAGGEEARGGMREEQSRLGKDIFTGRGRMKHTRGWKRGGHQKYKRGDTGQAAGDITAARSWQ